MLSLKGAVCLTQPFFSTAPVLAPAHSLVFIAFSKLLLAYTHQLFLFLILS